MPDPFSALAAIAESKIAEAMKNGEFDDLPGQGKPLELEDPGAVPEELRMAYKILKNAGCIPPELEQRREIGQVADLLEGCADEREKLRQMKKLRFLLERLQNGSGRHALLEANDEYLAKILARLERCERGAKGPAHS